MVEEVQSRQLIGTRVDATTMKAAITSILAAVDGIGGHVCCADVHMLVRARSQPELRKAMEAALLVCPDGAPVAWALRRLGFKVPGRVSGPELSWRLLAEAEARGLPVAFYGGRPDDTGRLMAEVLRRHPRLSVVADITPPFADATDPALAADLVALRPARLIFVGLGCPKQELWMHLHGPALPGTVLLGVGAWFDFTAGRIRRAPPWMQRCGMEWFYRVIADPRRLFWRYLRIVPTFLVLFAWQRLRGR